MFECGVTHYLMSVYKKKVWRMLISEYNNLPFYTKGFPDEERNFVKRELLEEKEKNIFYKSNIPIVNSSKEITYILCTDVLIEPVELGGNGNVRCVHEYYRYTLRGFDNIRVHRIYRKLRSLIYQKTKTRYFAPRFLKWSEYTIEYDYTKNLFFFSFVYLSGKPYMYMEINYSEEGTIKNAMIKYERKNGNVVSSFKTYKNGFDLYKVSYDGEIIYKRGNR